MVKEMEYQGSFWKVKYGVFKKILTFKKESSLGISYRTITSFLKFRANEHEGKVTGLSSYKLVDNKLLNLFKDIVFLIREKYYKK